MAFFNRTLTMRVTGEDKVGMIPTITFLEELKEKMEQNTCSTIESQTTGECYELEEITTALCVLHGLTEDFNSAWDIL